MKKLRTIMEEFRREWAADFSVTILEKYQDILGTLERDFQNDRLFTIFSSELDAWETKDDDEFEKIIEEYKEIGEPHHAIYAAAGALSFFPPQKKAYFATQSMDLLKRVAEWELYFPFMLFFSCLAASYSKFFDCSIEDAIRKNMDILEKTEDERIISLAANSLLEATNFMNTVSAKKSVFESVLRRLKGIEKKAGWIYLLKGIATLKLAEIQQNEKMIREGKELCERSFQKIKNSCDPKRTGIAYFNAGSASLKLYEWTHKEEYLHTAHMYLTFAEPLYSQVCVPRALAYVYQNLGTSLFYQFHKTHEVGILYEAFERFEKAFHLIGGIHDEKAYHNMVLNRSAVLLELARYMDMVGNLCSLQGQLEDALHYFEKTGLKERVLVTRLNLGSLLVKLYDELEDVHFLEKALKCAQDIKSCGIYPESPYTAHAFLLSGTIEYRLFRETLKEEHFFSAAHNYLESSERFLILDNVEKALAGLKSMRALLHEYRNREVTP